MTKEDLLAVLDEALDILDIIEGNEEALGRAWDLIEEAKVLIQKYAAE